MMSIGNTILPVAVTFNHVTLSSNAVVHPNCAPHELWDHLDLSWIWKTACSFTARGTCTCLVILQLLCIRAIPSPLPSCYWMFAQHNDIFWNGKMVVTSLTAICRSFYWSLSTLLPSQTCDLRRSPLRRHGCPMILLPRPCKVCVNILKNNHGSQGLLTF